MADRISTRLTAREGRRFGLAVGGAFLALTALFLWRDKDTLWRITELLGTLFVLGGLLVPTFMGPVERAWMKLAPPDLQGYHPISLGLLYIVVFTGVGGIMQLVGKRPMLQKKVGQSYWVVRPQTNRQSSLQRQF